jgi:RNA exonuclease 4
VTDAIKSMRLFNMHSHLRADPAQLSAAQSALLTAPQLPSFARRNPSFEGCCMGNRKTCMCGGTFFFS